ncbi:hypothetical protein AAHZ94_15080 [Streptomyces sp. HSW2009]|uniref:hypothetical protein n=1 Tax=Streptomyces sp. HSW2009 TaxID=3142890 RepID=UPI0032EFDA46
MTERVVRVALLVWQPVDPGAPGDVARGWPRVLLTRDVRSPWQLPAVVLRPVEAVMGAAGRVAYALGLELPKAHRVLAVEQHPPGPTGGEQLTLVVDGGWVAGAEVAVGEHAAFLCTHDCQHHSRWAGADEWETDGTLVAALGAAVGKFPAFVVDQEGQEGLEGQGGADATAG